jgi:hypothetical protein
MISLYFLLILLEEFFSILYAVLLCMLSDFYLLVFDLFNLLINILKCGSGITFVVIYMSI